MLNHSTKLHFTRNIHTRPAHHSRGGVKRTQIIAAAMRHFGEHGYHESRVGDIADELGIAKGSIFQHFGSKAGLFLEVYKRAVGTFPKYLDAPPEVVEKGFLAVVRYWLEHTEHLVREDWIPYRIYLLGNYGTELSVRREINRFLVSEDPYGTTPFVDFGIAGGEVRPDIDKDLIVSILDWTMERFQDALLTEELDPGLFRRQNNLAERTERRISQFIEILRGAVCMRAASPAQARPAEKAGKRKPDQRK